MAEKLLLGLDIGTNSVGWCLTDENSKIIKKNGKYLWGIRLFDESKSCKDRRIYRSTRRRCARRKQRLALLQDLFEKPMSKIDPYFFRRLKVSQIKNEDRNDEFNLSEYKNKYLFSDHQEEIEFYNKYPTIYHLRLALINSNEKIDLKYLYLVCAHYIKYRGHFLFEGQDFNVENGASIAQSLNCLLNEDNENNVLFETKDLDEIYDIYSNKKLDKKDKVNKIRDYLFNKVYEVNNDENEKIYLGYIAQLFLDSKVDAKKIYKDKDLDLDNTTISYDSDDFDSIIDELINVSSDYDIDSSFFENIKELKKVYDYLKLKNILGDSIYISEAIVKRFDKHKEDLIKLKNFVKTNFDRETYKKVFINVDDKVCNYPHFVGSSLVKGKKKKISKCKKDDFYKFLETTLNIKRNEIVKEENELSDKEYIEKRMYDGTFLELLRSSQNRFIPYQLNKKELEIILNNQSKYYEFLNESDDYGTVKDKIISLLTFKIPYYVGPLNESSKFAWIKKKQNQKITPWNFNDIVDKDASENEFIKRMANHCSYLFKEETLPKESLLYQEYELLSTLNKLYINNQPITNEIKTFLIDVYKNRGTKISLKDLKRIISDRFGDGNEIILTTSNDKELDENYLSDSLSSFKKFSNIFGKNYVESNVEKIDQIISICTIISDKNRLKDYLIKEFKLNEEDAIKVSKLKFSKFGRLSNKLLCKLKGIDSKTGEVICDKSIIQLMRETNQNLIEIINNKKYGFPAAINLENSEFLKEKYGNKELSDEQKILDFIDKLYISPKLKRPLIQAMKIINELENIMGSKEKGKRSIDEYYIEATRGPDIKAKGKATKNRRQKMLEIYKDAKDFVDEYDSSKAILSNLNGVEDSRLNSKKVFLYFRQLGKDLYTGNPIDFDRLETDYDIDHVFPQSKIKDDSFDNLVLTLKENNSDKGDIYPIPYDSFREKHNWSSKIRNRFFEKLHKNKFISETLYHRLTRLTPLTENELFNFVSSQITTTSQAVKAIKDTILQFKTNNENKEPAVILTKAQVISDFRKNHDLLKCREANDFHHAHDAYLNLIVGRAVNEYFTKYIARKSYLKNFDISKKLTTNINKFLDSKDSKGSDLNRPNIYDGDYLVWDYKDEKTLNEIKYNIYHNFNILHTVRTYEKAGIFSQVTISPSNPKGYALSIKNSIGNPLSNSIKYGGYSQLSFAYMMLIKNLDKNDKYLLIMVPSIYKDKLETKEFNDYVFEEYNVKNFDIILPKLKINTLIKENESEFRITGKADVRLALKNNKYVFYNEDYIKTIKNLFKITNKISEIVINKKYKNIDAYINDNYKQTSFGIYFDEEFIKLNGETLITKRQIVDLSNFLKKIIKNKIYDYARSSYDTMDNYLSYDNDLSLIKNMLILKECINRLRDSSLTFNLKAFGKGVISRERMQSNISKKISIIYESTTGYYRKVVWSNE